MELFKAYRDDLSRVAFAILGVFTLITFLLWNLVVFQSRVWNASFVARSMVIEAGLLAVGVGLILMRKWAALLCSALGGYLAIDLARSSADAVEASVGLFFLIPLIVTILFWKYLVWGNKLRDPLLVIAAMAISALIHYASFALRTRKSVHSANSISYAIPSARKSSPSSAPGLPGIPALWLAVCSSPRQGHTNPIALTIYDLRFSSYDFPRSEFIVDSHTRLAACVGHPAPRRILRFFDACET
jgi:hypothetical protein